MTITASDRGYRSVPAKVLFHFLQLLAVQRKEIQGAQSMATLLEQLRMRERRVIEPTVDWEQAMHGEGTQGITQ